MSIHILAGFVVNKGFLFAISRQKIKFHVVENQVTLLVWPCLNHLQKNRTIHHMIIFNDSISKFYQCCIWGFYRAISMFFSICLGEKNAEVIKFFVILKNMSPRIKYIFVQERKAICRLIKKLLLSFTPFSNLIS